jgi:hypothetical protein
MVRKIDKYRLVSLIKDETKGWVRLRSINVKR